MNVYIHVPFCASKCRYCAFHSQTGATEDDLRAFVRLLPREMELRGFSGAPADTVYIGGGTPSLLGPEGVRALLGGVFAVCPRPDPGTEVTVEVNPADITSALAAALAGAGVTRVSIGAQSFSDRTLRWLGRRHCSAETRVAAASVRAAGIPRLSLDLIAAVPGEAPEDFAESLREAVALGPDHVSVYPLSVEPGTPLALAGVRPPPDDAALGSVAEAERFLCGRGYARYELSNYALPGAECRHNMAVWLGGDYAGFGPAAHSRVGLERRANAPDFALWRATLEAGRLPPAVVERVTPEADEAERFLTRVRLRRWRLPDPGGTEGIRRAGILRGLEGEGIVRRGDAPDEWALTPRGREVADSVMAALA